MQRPEERKSPCVIILILIFSDKKMRPQINKSVMKYMNTGWRHQLFCTVSFHKDPKKKFSQVPVSVSVVFFILDPGIL